MFLVYVNDITVGENSYISLFENDAKFLKMIKKNTSIVKICRMIYTRYMSGNGNGWEMEFMQKSYIFELGKS